jgi:hypothetical protein
MTKQTIGSTLTMDLVFSSRLADAGEATSITQKANYTVKIKKRAILGKNIPQKFAFG